MGVGVQDVSPILDASDYGEVGVSDRARDGGKPVLVFVECGVITKCGCIRASARDRASAGPYECRDWSERKSGLSRYGCRSVFAEVQERDGRCVDDCPPPKSEGFFRANEFCEISLHNCGSVGCILEGLAWLCRRRRNRGFAAVVSAGEVRDPFISRGD